MVRVAIRCPAGACGADVEFPGVERGLWSSARGQATVPAPKCALLPQTRPGPQSSGQEADKLRKRCLVYEQELTTATHSSTVFWKLIAPYAADTKANLILRMQLCAVST